MLKRIKIVLNEFYITENVIKYKLHNNLNLAKGPLRDEGSATKSPFPFIHSEIDEMFDPGVFFAYLQSLENGQG